MSTSSAGTPWPTPRRIWRGWVRGRHSALPRCCVAYWTLIWDYLPSDFTWWAVLGGGARWFGDPGVPYVRCPLCRLRDHRVTIHHCDDECRGHPGWCGLRETERLRWYLDGEVYRLTASDN